MAVGNIGLASNINPTCQKTMEFGHEGLLEPASPTGQYIKSSMLSLFSIIGVVESETPLDDSMVLALLKDVFLPINPRFSSIMVTGEDGEKKWKRVKVNLQEHINIPKFPEGMLPDYYDECISNYLSRLGMEQFPQDRPLWEVHIIKHQTRNAAGNIIFKFHHALGDGYSFMGTLLSCLKRVDNPSLPLTFPSRQSASNFNNGRATTFLEPVAQFFSRAFSAIYDFGFGVAKSSLIPDDCSPIRSGVDGVEFCPMSITTMTFSLDQIKQIKAKLQVTVNDVITGMIMYGARSYMQQMNPDSSKSNTTVRVLLNTRGTLGYKSVSEMTKAEAEMPWGNKIAFLPLSIPKLTAAKSTRPLSFVMHAHRIIKRQRNPTLVYLTAQLIETIRKVKGSEAAGGYLHSMLKNSSMMMSNMIGPMEKMALANHPVKGIYFVVPGVPQSVQVTVISYVGELRITIATEKDFIDLCKFKSCIDNAFEAISKAAI